MAKTKDTIDTSKIDELYEIYCYASDMFAYESFLNAFNSKSQNGVGQVLIKNLEKYIDEYSKKIPSMYTSAKKEEQEKENIDIICYNLQNIALAVNYFLDDIDKQENIEYGFKHSHRHIRANDLFKFNDFTIQEAFEKQSHRIDISKKMFAKTMDLIKFLKDKKAIDKVLGNNDWYNMQTEDILLCLKDYYKDNQDKFEFCKHQESLIKEMLQNYSCDFFDNIKRNCDCSFEKFDKYRPMFISKQQMTPEIDKLIFCKNLLEFYKTGLFVDRNGYLDCRLDVIPDMLVSDFRQLYNTKFDEKVFKEKQANVIFNPDVNFTFARNYFKPENILSLKSIETDDGVVIGLLLENQTGEVYYLVHIAIKDICKDKSSYEIQLNLLPQGKIDKRIQLLRVDNYETQQAHKNLGGKRLATSTHVHLYNHFDLLRGKVNGNYDISHNLENSSTDFISALNSFLSVMDLDVELHKEIIKKIKEIKKRRVRKEIKTNTEI